MSKSGWILSAVTEHGTEYVRYRIVQPAPDQSFESYDLTLDRAEAHRFPTRETAEAHNALRPFYRIEAADD